MMPLLPTFAQSHRDIEPLLNTIHHCDAFELLARLPDESVDMCLLDLPYGVTACKWDTPLDLDRLWPELRRITKPRAAIVMTATQPFTSRLVSSNYAGFKYSWMWEKTRPSNYVHAHNMPLSIYEDVLVFSYGSIGHKSLLGDNRISYYPQGLKRIDKILKQKVETRARWGQLRPSHKDTSILEFTNYPTQKLKFASEGNTLHSTQKPVALFEYLIKTYTRENEIVLDFVSGSGTSAIAARKCNRQFICGDITLDYVIASRKRLQDSDPYQATELANGQKQLSLFEDLPSNMEIVSRDSDGFAMVINSA